MPETTGYCHLSLTVIVDKSIAWWTKVPGFDIVRQFERDGITKVALRHPGNGTYFNLTGHGSKSSGSARSAPAWTNVAFAVAGDLISFRDPDYTAIEVYADTPLGREPYWRRSMGTAERGGHMR